MRLLIALIFLSTFAYGQRTDGQLKTLSNNEIKNKAYAPARAGAMFDSLITSKVSILGTYADPAFITSLAMSKVTGLTAALAAKADASALTSGLNLKVDKTTTVNSQPLSGNITLTAANVGAVPISRTVNAKALSADITLNAADVSAVPTTRTVNSKALSADIALTAADVSAVPTTRTVNAKPLSSDITLNATDVGAVPTTRTVNSQPLSTNVVLAASDVGAVPTTRTVNTKPLSSDITLSASDVSAQPANAQLTTVANMGLPNQRLRTNAAGNALEWFDVAAGGTGTVTSVSVTTANGVSGSVATSTTTPAISLTLGAITPTSVNGTTSTEISRLSGVTSSVQSQINSLAPLASPVFTGAPSLPTGTTAVTQTANDGSNKIATTLYTDNALAAKLNVATPTFTGTMTGPNLTLTGRLSTAGSTVTAAGVSIPAGTAPTTPLSGDLWANSTTLFYRTSVTNTLPFLENANTWVGKQTVPASTSGGAGLNIPPGTAPSGSINGDIWNTSVNWFVKTNNLLKTLATLETANTWTATQTLPAPTFTGIATHTATVGNQLNMSSSAASSAVGIQIAASASTSESQITFVNDRASTALSYGAIFHGGSANVLGNIFGVSRADKTLVVSDGSSNLGMGVGTLVNSPLILGTNNSARMTFLGTGQAGLNATAATTSFLTLGASTTATVPLNIGQGTAPTTPNNGDIYQTSAGLFNRFNGILYQVKTRQPTLQTITSVGTVTPLDVDMTIVTAQAAAVIIGNPATAPAQGQDLWIRLKDDGTARAISYGTQYRAIGVTLPTTTVATKTIYLHCIWNSTDTFYDIVDYRLQP